jgi:hypothetical protein
MSAIKNFFVKKSDRIDGSFAVLIIAGALAVSGLNVATAAPAKAPVEQVKTVVTSGGSAGTTISVSGSAGLNLGGQ